MADPTLTQKSDSVQKGWFFLLGFLPLEKADRHPSCFVGRLLRKLKGNHGNHWDDQDLDGFASE
jgi:hypothetical protein